MKRRSFEPLRALRRRLGAEDGWAMATVMGVLLIASVFSVAAISAAQGDIGLTGGDDDRKAGYSAAEAWAAYYTQQLDRDRDYWRLCDGVPPPQPGGQSPVRQPWDGSSSRGWRSLPDSAAQYTIELLPANGYSQCVPGNDASMIDASSGTLRIRATGRSSPTDRRPRSIVVTYRRSSFLDFIYFTDYETQDPLLPGGSSACATYHHAGPRPSSCEIRFVSGDRVNGPLHSNDNLGICGSPVFGRTAEDEIETPGYWAPNSSCPANPTFVGQLQTQSPPLTLPPSDSELASKALPAYTFTGKTVIVLNNNRMLVTNAARGWTNQDVGLPSNGLIYVTETACTTPYAPSNPYNRPVGCAEAYVSGTYSENLTVASKRDVVVANNITRSGDKVLGLVAEQFVRVYHRHRDCGDTFTDYIQNINIDAAILSLKHSFIVDNFDCGPTLGTLTVNGAIAQAHRGPVGQSGNPTRGYLKNYNYDDRLRGRSPPFFLDPVASAWKVIRYNEQVPPCGAAAPPPTPPRGCEIR